MHALHPPLTTLLKHLLALCGAGIVPALAQFPALLRRKLLEPVEILSHSRLLIGRERLEFFPPLAQCLPLVRRKGVPPVESLAREITLLR